MPGCAGGIDERPQGRGRRVGPLIGGLATTYFSLRWVCAGEVVMVLGILLLARRITEVPIGERARIDGLWTPRVTGG